MFWSLVLLGTAVTASPAVAVAQPNATLYEVTETMSLKGGKMVRRLAVAALSGTVDAGTALCPAELADALGVTKCSINAIAHDNVNLATGRGPISGTFAIVVQDMNTTDGPEVVIVRGTVTGQVDISPAVFSNVPLGTLLEGTWSATGVRGGPMEGFRAQGTLTGTFRLPFEIAPGVAAYMLNPFTFPADGSFDFVLPKERSLDEPTVRLEINFETR
ncbi:MAG: hypothetical protein AUH29_17610 [Candidatus Rokubacteria bacterium 13_1_40CM_69_27]|nr:MAG: hypothetical protein AUH29_17610 [Candidatus Rokubacteria bacterium 13_1_40CM_69_27]OLC36975.1 MAG: hypothetical protein AUH81_07380 [Candidatus Rokubacteria bacterium 13_1_40CM_4_69_5]